jgi:hypothetical protein
MTILMTTSRAALGGLLALALLPALWPGGAAAHTCDDPFRTDLVTARGIDVGEVEVCNDAESLTVTYETTFPWCVLKTDLHVASDPAGIPKTRLGTPKWWKFDYGDRHECEGEVPFEIGLADIDGGVDPGETVAIAARAVVEGEDKKACFLGGLCVAWGEGPRFRKRLPAMYFTYEVQEPPPACPCAGNIDQALGELLADGASVGFHDVLAPLYFVDATCMPTAGNVVPGEFGLITIGPVSCLLQAGALSEVANTCSFTAFPSGTSVPFGDAEYTDFSVPLAPGEQQECIDYAEQAIGELFP